MTRIECPHAPPCGGCPALAYDYAVQLERKQARLRHALGYHGSLAHVQLAPPVGAEPIVGYRVRAKLVVAPGPRLGLYAEGGGHDVVDIPECRVLAPALADVARTLRQLLGDAPPEAGAVLRPASKVRGGALRAVDLREVLTESGEARVMLTLILDGAAKPPAEAAQAAAQAIAARAPAVVSIALSTQTGRGPQLLGSPPKLLWGEHAVRDRLDPAAPAPFVLASPGGFVQAHRRVAARIRGCVADALEHALGTLADCTVLDAYAGSGAIGLALSARGARVVSIESFAPAALAAANAARAQALVVEARPGDAADLLLDMLHRGERPDAIVLNPPRRGVTPAVRALCAALAPRALVYLSCEPDTLGRDLADLARLGLGCDELVPHDMMPHTDEVEIVAVLRPTATPAPIVLHHAVDLVAVDKPGHEPMVARHAGEGSLRGRLAAVSGLAAALPVHHLDADTSGVCLFAHSAASAARWAKALGEIDSRKEYLALCRGITRVKGVVSRPSGAAARAEARRAATGDASPQAKGDASRAGQGNASQQARGKQARTRYRRVEVVGGHSLLRVSVEHGRPQDIRRHLASIGHPVLGDARYGHAPSNRHLGEKHGLDRPFLHCACITLLDPTTQRRLELESPLAGDLQLVLDRLAALPAG